MSFENKDDSGYTGQNSSESALQIDFLATREAAETMNIPKKH